MIGSRCSRGEHNLLVFNGGGQCIGADRVGDGIEDFSVTHAGDLWVSYFDEGVFGDDAVAAAGCVRWRLDADAHGNHSVTPAWRLDYKDMADCYAMNVTDQATYVCPYVGFPIIVMLNDRSTILPSEAAGPRALVTDGYRMAVIGSYSKLGSVMLGTLEHDRFRKVGITKYEVPGVNLRDVTVTGRGDHLHGFSQDGRWWSTTLDELWGPLP